jgi:dTDP-glucose 4,6-dehydratase
MLFKKKKERIMPDYVVSFAAESHVDNSISSPHKFIKTNIDGVFNMLQAARELDFASAKDFVANLRKTIEFNI